jgi:septal ring factor EnvC (AmiA/AmiB activator)
VGELQARIERLSGEKAQVERLVREHGERLQAFYRDIEQLKETVRSREEMVRERGAQLQSMNADLADVTQRLVQREAELSRIKGHWYWRIARLIIR